MPMFCQWNSVSNYYSCVCATLLKNLMKSAILGISIIVCIKVSLKFLRNIVLPSPCKNNCFLPIFRAVCIYVQQQYVRYVICGMIFFCQLRHSTVKMKKILNKSWSHLVLAWLVTSYLAEILGLFHILKIMYKINTYLIFTSVQRHIFFMLYLQIQSSSRIVYTLFPWH